MPVAVHVDGLEWQRAKWSGLGSWYYRMAERVAVRRADELIADNGAIQEYYAMRHGVATTLLTYGTSIVPDGTADRLGELGLEPGRFHLIVARFEPENCIDVCTAGYRASAARWPLVVVGSVAYGGAYVRRVMRRAQGDPRIRMLSAVWDQDLLDQLYCGAGSYVHGHTVGGTNPSLLRAMGAGAPVIAADVPFTREVAGDDAEYFRSQRDVTRLIEQVERDPGTARARGGRGRSRVVERYDWDEVASGYEAMCERLVAEYQHGRVTS
jgi:glycosyltransferase involved in cell wall biosynthesis